MYQSDSLFDFWESVQLSEIGTTFRTWLAISDCTNALSLARMCCWTWNLFSLRINLNLKHG